MDLSTLDTRAACDNSIELELRHPATNAPLNMFISVTGKDSAAYQNELRSMRNAAMRKAQMAQRKGKEQDITTAEEIDDKAVSLVVAATTGWRDGQGKKDTFTVDGKELAFNKDNAIAFYARFTWAKDQVDEFIGDIANFMQSK